MMELWFVEHAYAVWAATLLAWISLTNSRNIRIKTSSTSHCMELFPWNYTPLFQRGYRLDCCSVWFSLSASCSNTPFFFSRWQSYSLAPHLSISVQCWQPDMARSAHHLWRPGNTVVPHYSWSELQMRNLIIRGNWLWDSNQLLNTVRVAYWDPYFPVPSSVTLLYHTHNLQTFYGGLS